MAEQVRRRCSSSSSSDSSDNEPEQPKPAFVFPQIVDVFSELANNNPLPFLILLQKKDESVNIMDKDQNGYNAFHYLLMSGNYTLVNLLIDHSPDFLKETTGKAQTNLMIAVNQRNFSVFNLVLKHSSEDFNTKDAYGFTVFLYAMRNNSIVVFFKLLSVHVNKLFNQSLSTGEVFDSSPLSNAEKDNSGCTLLHWAAFRDSLFMLKLMFRFHADFSESDKEGRIAFERATQNNAVRCVDFMLEYSGFPFMTNFFLYGSFDPVEFDFLPESPGKVLVDYHSPALRDKFRKMRTGRVGIVERAKDSYCRYNLRFKFGALAYIVWSIASLLLFVNNTRLDIEAVATYCLHLATLLFSVHFYT